MDTKTMIPIDFSRKITPFVLGDILYSESIDESFEIDEEDQAAAFNLKYTGVTIHDNDYFVVSFADRPNTGTQPVGDDVMINVDFDHLCENIPASSVFWEGEGGAIGVGETWKPNKESMLKQYQAEQLEQEAKRMDNITMNGNDGEHYEKANIEKAAVKTLGNLGYSYHGSELWKPPIGKKPDYIEKEINAATALYAFAGWLTSMKEPITFSASNWATPAADMAAAFIELNNLSGDIDFDSVKTPNDSVISKALVNESEDDGPSVVETPVFTQAMKDSGSRLTIGMHYLDDVGKRCEYVGISSSCIIGRYVDMENVRSDHLSVCDEGKIEPIQTDEDNASQYINEYFEENDDAKLLIEEIKAGKIHGVKWVGK